MRNAGVNHSQEFILVSLLLIQDVSSQIDDLEHISRLFVDALEAGNFDLHVFVFYALLVDDLECLDACFSLFHLKKLIDAEFLHRFDLFLLQVLGSLAAVLACSNIFIPFLNFFYFTELEQFDLEELCHVFSVNVLKFMLLLRADALEAEVLQNLVKVRLATHFFLQLLHRHEHLFNVLGNCS